MVVLATCPWMTTRRAVELHIGSCFVGNGSDRSAASTPHRHLEGLQVGTLPRKTSSTLFDCWFDVEVSSLPPRWEANTRNARLNC